MCGGYHVKTLTPPTPPCKKEGVIIGLKVILTAVGVVAGNSFGTALRARALLADRLVGLAQLVASPLVKFLPIAHLGAEAAR